MGSYLDSINPTGMSVAQIKTKAEIVKKIWANFSELNLKVKNANTELFKKYNFLEKYKDNRVFKKAVKDDLYILNNKISDPSYVWELRKLNKYKMLLERNKTINKDKETVYFHKAIYTDIRDRNEARKYLSNTYNVIEKELII